MRTSGNLENKHLFPVKTISENSTSFIDTDDITYKVKSG